MPQSAPPAKPRAAVILAAGHGTRMKSATSKVLHSVGGRAMLDWSTDLARESGAERIVVVAGAHSPAVGERARTLGCEVAIQDPPQGTGHAVNCARAALADFDGDVVVLYADTPLIRHQTVRAAFDALVGAANVVVLGFEAADPAEYGRLVETAEGLDRIVEFKDASAEERAITLCNSGVLAAPARLLFELLGEVRNDNAKGEYYLTDVVGLARGRGLAARAVRCPESEVLGVNSRVDLAAAEAAFQSRARREAMLAGTTLIAPETVFLSYDTVLGRDVIVEPNVVFGPGVRVEDGAVIHAFSHLEGAEVASGASVGPYARLRPGAVVGRGAKVGNFVEIKNARLGVGAKANHLSYLGDAEIGAGANIGAGTITCNYDGFAKHKTVVGDGAFIGSDTALVAPVTVGAGAYTGSGSVITKDVAPGALAVARGRQRDIEGWAEAFRLKQAALKASKKAAE